MDVGLGDELSDALEAVMDGDVDMDADTKNALRESARQAADLELQEIADQAALAAGVRESILLHCRDEGATSSASGLQPWERLPRAPASTPTALLPPLPRKRTAPAPALLPAGAPAQPLPNLVALQAQIADLMVQLADIRQGQTAAVVPELPLAPASETAMAASPPGADGFAAAAVPGTALPATLVTPSTSASPVAAVAATVAKPFMDIAPASGELVAQALPAALTASLAPLISTPAAFEEISAKMSAADARTLAITIRVVMITYSVLAIAARV